MCSELSIYEERQRSTGQLVVLCDNRRAGRTPCGVFVSYHAAYQHVVFLVGPEEARRLIEKDLFFATKVESFV